MTAIQTKPSGRIVSTIPSKQADNARLDGGEDVSWHVLSRDRLRISIEEQGTERPTTQVRYDDYSGSFTVTIPKHLAYAMHLVNGTVEWEYKRPNLILEIESRGGEAEE